MWIGIIAVLAAACSAAIYIYRCSRNAEIKKYYDAAFRLIKEGCLNQAISSQSRQQYSGQKIMLYLKWKDSEKRGFVFDPERGVRIGRSPEENELCIPDEEVSGKHCVIFLSQGQLYVQDMNSANGTWLKQGISKRPVLQAEPVFSGDRLMIGKYKIQVTVFSFDMAYI